MGVIGLSPEWDCVYRPAFDELAARVRIAAVCDSVSLNAQDEARRSGGFAVGGVIPLMNRPDVDALVVLDTGWHGHHLLPRIASCGKPVFLGLDFDDLECLEYLHSVVTLNRAVWVPRLLHRFAPATTRLMELIATQLGPPRRVEMTLSPDREAWSIGSLLTVIDWSYFVLQRATSIRFARVDQAGCRIRFDVLEKGFVDLSLYAARDSEPTERRVQCARGQATLHSDQRLTWQLTGQRHPITETLEHDHSAAALQLAIFLRRAAGGLIPTADLSDLHRGLVAARQISRAWF